MQENMQGGSKLKQNIKTDKLRVEGMSCANCESKIEDKLNGMVGVKEVKASYSKETVIIRYDMNSVSLKKIIAAVEKLGYGIVSDNKSAKSKSGSTDILGTIIVVFAVFVLLKHFGFLDIFNMFPEAEAGMGYGMLFIIGILTSVHCIAMCGGINLSQCIPQNVGESDNKLSVLKPSLLYNLGRVISYTAIGALVGALGSVISFSGMAKGLVQILASIFMVIMGLNMLNVAPWLKKLNPRLPKSIARKINKEKASNNTPLYVGLLNGLMPCGPLQAMQIYALSTGDPIKGALSMFIFSIGTVPLMFGLGALSTVLSQKFTKKMMSVGAVLVIILGFSMLNNGLSLSGFNGIELSDNGSDNSESNQVDTQDGIQLVTTNLSFRGYPPITVKVGTPVKWIIKAEKGSITGCNNRIFIPEYGIEKKLEFGENIIEFTPTETGTFVYSCWMGMIRSKITVTD